MDYLYEGLANSPLYPFANSTLDRTTNGTVSVPRISGKIALEEAVGSVYWDAYTTLPPTNQLNGFDGVPFDEVST